MPIRKRASNTRYIYIDKSSGELVLRTPPSVLHWPARFRLLLVRDWQEPGTVLRTNELDALTKAYEGTIYPVEGKRVEFLFVSEEADNTQFRVLSHIVLRLAGSKQGFLLTHPNPIMRSLQVYCFTTGKVLGGLASMEPYNPL